MNWRDLSHDIVQLTDHARDIVSWGHKHAMELQAPDVAVDLWNRTIWMNTPAPYQGIDAAFLVKNNIKQAADLPTHDYVYFVKQSSFRVSDLTRPAADFFSYANKAIGGPNALTTTLVGSAIGGLGGYGLGRVADAVIPASLRTVLPKYAPGGPQDKEHELIGNSHWAHTLGMMGAAAGAVPGLIRASAASSAGHDLTSPFPWTADLPKRANFAFEDAMDSTGAMFTPSIPVDAFNQAIWANAMPNPYGSKSNWGDNSAQMFTPPRDAALIGGLVSAAGAARQQSHVSPWDIARVATEAAVSGGMGAVMGSATGLMAGKLLGGLAGLSPAGQQYAQQTGLWAGLVSGLANKLF